MPTKTIKLTSMDELYILHALKDGEENTFDRTKFFNVIDLIAKKINHLKKAHRLAWCGPHIGYVSVQRKIRRIKKTVT